MDKVAIIGGGVAGLTAGYLLNDHCDLTLFERSHRVGGNAYTLTLSDGEEVDIAVAAFGKAGYPNFYKLMDRLGVETSWNVRSYGSMHDLDTGKGYYLTPLSPKGLLAQRFEMFKPKHLRSVVDTFVGLTSAKKMLSESRLEGLTMRQCIEAVPWLRGEARLMVLCALCLMSSMSAAEVLDAPAEFFIGKLSVHSDVVSPKASWSVRCVKGKTKEYIGRLVAGFQDRIKLEAAVARVERGGDCVTVVMEGGEHLYFDRVIFACHADQALALLAEPTAGESELLGAWRYKNGRIVVHSDYSSFPKRELIQAYTFLYTLRDGTLNTSVNGALWHEPGVSNSCRYICTQHPNFAIDDDLIEFETVLRTPIYDFDSFVTLARLPELNGIRNSYYCGSYFGYGLHEDAVASAIAVAKQLGAEW